MSEHEILGVEPFEREPAAGVRWSGLDHHGRRQLDAVRNAYALALAMVDERLRGSRA